MQKTVLTFLILQQSPYYKNKKIAITCGDFLILKEHKKGKTPTKRRSTPGKSLLRVWANL